MKKTITVIGGAGYVARELIACLARHPEVTIQQVVSESQTGKSVSDFHKDPAIDPALIFNSYNNKPADVLFLCGGHGFSKQFLDENEISQNTLVIDLSMDFRRSTEFVYGLPESPLYQSANRIANPGCFATAIQLGILPMLGKMTSDWHIHAMTGSSGAGQQLQHSSHFSWRENNVSTYKVFEHQHLLEMNHHGKKITETFPKLHFTPLRGPFTRGIFATMYTETEMTTDDVLQCYTDYYREAKFVHVQQIETDLKQVVGTNYCFLQPRVIGGKLFVTSIIDNLLKGAAGQAIQNMNRFFGWSEHTGLNLKPHFL
jgi:N-acetyl-gamma-glutamyl-phosphate reductase